MAKRQKSVFGKIAHSVSSEYRNERGIANVLNWCERNMPKLLDNKVKDLLDKEYKSKSDDENAKIRLEGHAINRMVKLLLANKFAPMIELWNPNDESKDRLLGERFIDKLKIGEETDYKKGGISPYQLTVTAYGIGKIYMKRHGTTWNENGGVTLDQIDLDAYRKGEANEATEKFVGELFEIADEYNSEKDESYFERKQEKEQQKDEPKAEMESVESDVTVDDYINGEVELKDVESVDLLEQFHEDERITGAKKGAVTRRKNELMRESE